MIEAALRQLFPAACAVACCRAAEVPAGLPPEEAAAVAAAGPKRRQEFAAGRQAARAALRRLGLGEPAIPSGADRAPQWPAGTVGSIAHTEGCAVAVAARSAEVRALGLDLERDGAVRAELWPQMFRPEEIDRLRRCAPGEQAREATIMFCAKEAFYKFQYPHTRAWLEFTDAEVFVDRAQQRVRVVSRRPVALDSTAMYNFEGGFVIADAFTLVGLHLAVAFAPKPGVGRK